MLHRDCLQDIQGVPPDAASEEVERQGGYGKMLTDMISTIVYLSTKKDLLSTELALTEVPMITQSLMCVPGKDGMVRVDSPNAQAKRVYKVFGIKLPNQFSLEDLIAENLS